MGKKIQKTNIQPKIIQERQANLAFVRAVILAGFIYSQYYVAVFLQCHI